MLICQIVAPMLNGLLVTDLDGTLLHEGKAHPAASSALRRLPDQGVLRVAATGRSLGSYRKLAFAADAPLDVLVFSSGAGVLDLRGAERLWRATALRAPLAERARRLLSQHDFDFMIHPPVPDEHRFHYRASAASQADRQRNPDFWRRVATHPEGSPLPHASPTPAASALLAVVGASDGERCWRMLDAALEDLTVLRTTSPLDHRSTWIEIFPHEVSKSQTCAWVARQLQVPRERVLCLGNDYNDLDLLAWGGAAYVTSDAPEPLRARYATIPAAGVGGVVEGLERWLMSLCGSTSG
jgi:hydroxymethylpyrimidine pyrophosphatase-like HAD family hydrolase